MQIAGVASRTKEEFRFVSGALSRWFPTPGIMTPSAAGIDISDASVKWVVLDRGGDGLRVHTYGEIEIPSGVVEGGVVKNVESLSDALKQVKKKLGGVVCTHAALPEESAYVFSMRVPPETPRDQVLRMIEFEFEGRVPIPPSAAVYDFNPLPSRTSEDRGEIAVVVFPRDITEAYVAAFELAGLTLLSLEVEASSIARTISTGEHNEPITLLVDFGRARTGFAVVKKGFPIFTSTVEVGGESITRSLMEGLSMTKEQAEDFKNTQGLLATDPQTTKEVEILTKTATALSDAVARHYHYWDTRRNEHGDRMTPVGQIVLVGGNANMRGLAEFIAGRVQAPTKKGDVWQRFGSFDEYIPPISRAQSFQYATAIGLALRGI